MSLTLTLSGCSSQLSNSFYPPIQLDNANYKIALLKLEVYNSIPNVSKKNNSLSVVIQDTNHVLYIPTGTYEIEDLSTCIAEMIKLKSNETLDLENLFYIKANTNTMQTIIFCKYPVSFDVKNSVASLLGISNKTKIIGGETIFSEKIANINAIDVIRIQCNLASGSYLNGQPSHTIYEFTPDVPPGYKIIEVPKNLIYLPLINTQSISEISIKFVDQNQKIVNFRGERTSVVLVIEKNNGAKL